MVSNCSRKVGVMRRWAAGIAIGASALAATGCSLLPTTDDIRHATTTVKDTVTGKARKDKLNKTYAEARILERRKDFTSAERLYRELLVAEPKSRDCYHRLGVMAAVQGKYVEAHRNYQAALKCSQPTPDLLSDIGYCHYLQNQLPLADQALRSALALDPHHAAATNNLALVVGEQGNLEEAYELFRKANGEAEAECNFAYLCAQCGDLPTAQAHFSRALSVNPDMRPAAEALLHVTSTMQRRQDEARARLTQLAAQGNQPQSENGASAPQSGVVIQAGAQQPTTQSVAQAGFPQPATAASGVSLSGGYAQAAASQNGGVQLASNNVDPAVAARAAQALAAAPQQRLIEVYRGGPRTAAGSAQIAAASQAASQQTAIAPHSAAPTAPAPMNTAAQPGFPPSATPGPFSFPASPSPLYLQPSMQSRMPSNDGSGDARAQGPASGVAPASYNAPLPSAPTSVGGNRPAGLSFPPL